jgi:cell division protein ZapA
MAQVAVTVNGRTFEIACDDGQEQRVAELSRDIDRRVAALARSIGQVGENRLLLLAGLMIADELSEAQSTLAKQNATPRADETAELELANRLDQLARRVEAIAARLSAA